jgi:hypothetical protein
MSILTAGLELRSCLQSRSATAPVESFKIVIVDITLNELTSTRNWIGARLGIETSVIRTLGRRWGALTVNSGEGKNDPARHLTLTHLIEHVIHLGQRPRCSVTDDLPVVGHGQDFSQFLARSDCGRSDANFCRSH